MQIGQFHILTKCEIGLDKEHGIHFQTHVQADFQRLLVPRPPVLTLVLNSGRTTVQLAWTQNLFLMACPAPEFSAECVLYRMCWCIRAWRRRT
jgi:hypothetical protein